jgi:hypothetical protein
MLALELFSTLQEENKVQPVPISENANEPEPLTKGQLDILEFIGGFILYKMRQRGYASVAQIFAEDTNGQPDDQVEESWIDALNRGGLTKPNDSFRAFVQDMEMLFRRLLLADTGREQFIANVETGEAANILRQDSALTESELSPDLITDFIIAVAKLFFITRIHQKCRNLMEQYSKKTNLTRKRKALRDTL